MCQPLPCPLYRSLFPRVIFSTHMHVMSPCPSKPVIEICLDCCGAGLSGCEAFMAPTFLSARFAGSGIATGDGMSMVSETREGVSDGTKIQIENCCQGF